MSFLPYIGASVCFSVVIAISYHRKPINVLKSKASTTVIIANAFAATTLMETVSAFVNRSKYKLVGVFDGCYIFSESASHSSWGYYHSLKIEETCCEIRSVSKFIPTIFDKWHQSTFIDTLKALAKST